MMRAQEKFCALSFWEILHSLEKEGFLSSRWCESEENGRKRKYYKDYYNICKKALASE